MPASHKVYKNKLLRTVEQTIITYGMLKSKDSVVVGVSGGPDSVALVHVLLTLAPRFSLRIGVAHLNHCLRQNDSDKEAEFVASLASKFNLPFYLKKEDVRKYQQENKLSLEEAARRVRYTFYDMVAQKNRFNKIALGHHCDDNTELVLMNLIRGSGPLGISGIPPVRDGKIIRPLIKVTKSEIVDFLYEKGLKYVSDKSNREMNCLRNRIRHHLIPVLKTTYNPKIVEILNRLASISSSEAEWIEDVIDSIFQKALIDVQDNSVAISVPILVGMHIATQRRVIRKAVAKVKGNLRSITFAHIESVLSHLKSPRVNKSFDLPDRIRIRLVGEVLLFSKEKRALRDLHLRSNIEQAITFEYDIKKPGTIFLKEIGARMAFSEIGIENTPDFSQTGLRTGFFDMDAIRYPLVLRNFRPGDRFTPLGMSGTQKVKKYFINNKIPKTERSRCPILLCQGRIIWVVGHRIDESAKVKPSTRNVLKAELALAE